MSNIAIKAENLGKLYRVGQFVGYKTLRESIANAFSSPFRRRARRPDHRPSATSHQPSTNFIWALKDVSFEVKHGEVVGIIGRNGMGKTTLLKILSRITEPTEGRAEIHGRVGSLLEVGTGFHPELTGRENVYLSGAILGMKRDEIDRKFDEIVAFAELEKFVDTPVKYYSSGMYVRLAFAVAAHLEPEILLVDEVLAVGDIRFQKKCLEKMGEIGVGGRTVLFVSHSMPSITRLCQRTILLNEGQVIQDGPSQQVVATYLQSDLGTVAKREWRKLNNAPGDDIVRLRAVYVQNEDGKVSEAIDICRPFALVMRYNVLKPDVVLTPVFRLTNQYGMVIFTAIDTDPEWRQQPRPTGCYTTMAWIPANLMAEGTVFVFAGISTISPTVKHVREQDVIAFQIVDNASGNSARGDWGGEMPGVVRPLLQWITKRQELS